MAETKIEWADKVWNPITGCSPISEGCQNCYARRMANRLKGRYGYPKDEPFRLTFHPDRLEEPLRWKKPCRIFVCSMGDLFHEKVDWFWFNKILETITRAERHTYLILTKRPERAMKWWHESFNDPPNIWLGVSVENQRTADERIPILLQIPATKKFVSVEPMLGPVNLEDYFYYGKSRYEDTPGGQRYHIWDQTLNWIICGGETGPKARPMHPDWVRSLRDQCQAAGVLFFFKSWGKLDWIHDADKKDIKIYPGDCIIKAGQKSSHLLDHRLWEERPE